MNREMLLLLFVAQLGNASATGESDRVGGKALPTNAVLICDEHVVGEASGKPMHIDWQAYGLHEETEKVMQFYQSQFGRPSASDKGGQSSTWTFKGEYNELQYSVKAASADGPWVKCAKQPTGYKAVVFISNAIWKYGR